MRLWRITGLAGTLQPEMEFNDSDPNGRKEAEESPWLSMNLPKDGNCRVEVIDTWEMTRDVVMERAHGRVRVELPGKEGMAVLVSKL